MDPLSIFLRSLGLTGRHKKIGGDLPLPDLGEVKDTVEKAVEGLSGLKDVPKTIMDRVVEADQDFRGADKALRSTRLRKKR